MLNEVDKEYLKHDILIDFCEKYNITDIDTHYYLKLAYTKINNKLSEQEIKDLLYNMYLAFEEHFYKYE